MVHFRLDGLDVETLDTVRYGAVLRYLDRLGPTAGEWPQIRALGTGGEVNGTAVIEELDRLARQGVPENLAPMLGNIRNDVLRALRTEGKLGPTE
jgi:hypothetical protein